MLANEVEQLEQINVFEVRPKMLPLARFVGACYLPAISGSERKGQSKTSRIENPWIGCANDVLSES